MEPIVEELPPANDRRQWRILHPTEGTIASYVGSRSRQIERCSAGAAEI
jgi:hypothetical protein